MRVHLDCTERAALSFLLAKGVRPPPESLPSLGIRTDWENLTGEQRKSEIESLEGIAQMAKSERPSDNKDTGDKPKSSGHRTK